MPYDLGRHNGWLVAGLGAAGALVTGLVWYVADEFEALAEFGETREEGTELGLEELYELEEDIEELSRVEGLVERAIAITLRAERDPYRIFNIWKKTLEEGSRLLGGMPIRSEPAANVLSQQFAKVGLAHQVLAHQIYPEPAEPFYWVRGLGLDWDPTGTVLDTPRPLALPGRIVYAYRPPSPPPEEEEEEW